MVALSPCSLFHYLIANVDSDCNIPFVDEQDTGAYDVGIESTLDGTQLTRPSMNGHRFLLIFFVSNFALQSSEVLGDSISLDVGILHEGRNHLNIFVSLQRWSRQIIVVS